MGRIATDTQMTLIEKLHTLTPELQREVEDFVEFLQEKQRRLAAHRPEALRLEIRLTQIQRQTHS